MSLHILILAGGRSSRMGQDKAKLTLVDTQQTLLAHMLEIVADLAADTVHISRPYQQQPYDVALLKLATERNPQVKVIYDEESYLGPLAGMQACLQQLALVQRQTSSQILVLPIDMPALHLADLQQLIGYSRQQCCSCYFQQHFLPMVIYDLAQLQQLLNQLMLKPTRERSFRNLLSQLSANSIDTTNAQLSRLINLNTPEQWQTYLDNRN